MDAEKVEGQHLDEAEEIEALLKPLDKVITTAKNGELLQSMQVSTVFFTLASLNRIC